ncbi:hypothetical protein AAVH_06528 [Aphelenchoides avenae]|nr:hypothetical protein AAVH_06528 [Aphelenchus avenae]
MSSLQDSTLLGHTVETGVDDFACALKVYESGTSEARNLLLNETTPIFECKSCRALFRYIDAFVAHKQGGCEPTTTSDYLSGRRSKEVVNDHDYVDVFKVATQGRMPDSAVNKADACDAHAKPDRDRVITNGYNNTSTQPIHRRYNGGASAMHAREPAPSRWTVMVKPRRSAPASAAPPLRPDATAHGSPDSPALLTPPSETASLSSESSSGSNSHRRSARQRVPSKRLQPYILDPLLSPPSEERGATTGQNYGGSVHRDPVQRKDIVRGSTTVHPPLSTRIIGARQELPRRIEDAIRSVGVKVANPRMASIRDMSADGKQKVLPTDLATVPVLMTPKQRDLFFSPLMPPLTFAAKDDYYQCAECGTLALSLQEGQRHVVSHVRAIRMQCRLCNAGAFYCQDMRRHLMYRHCERLHMAPEGYVAEGTVVPCMDVKKADELVRFADVDKPGRLTLYHA